MPKQNRSIQTHNMPNTVPPVTAPEAFVEKFPAKESRILSSIDVHLDAVSGRIGCTIDIRNV